MVRPEVASGGSVVVHGGTSHRRVVGAVESLEECGVEMIVATGIDLVEIDRFRRVMERWGDRFLRRVFTPNEIEYSRNKRFPHRSLAARFAAKEAVRKVLDDSVAWRSIEVINEPSGKPAIRLATEAPGRIALSLSHTREHALAQAILIDDERGG